MIRKQLFYILLCLAFTQLSEAQFKFSASGGINLANGRLKNSYTNHYSFLSRLNAGADFAFFFDENWGIQTGLYYQGKGWKEKIGSFDSVIVRLNYIELPLKVAYTFTTDNDKSFLFASGFYCGYGFKAKTTFTGSPQLTYDPFKEKNYKRFDFGYIIESSFFIKSNYGIKLGYSNGLLKLDRPDGSINNYVFNLSLLWLPGKK